MKKIIPAILTKDIADLENKLAQLQGLTDWVQIDIMDETLVSNSTITLEDIEKSEAIKEFSLEAHLMVKNPESYFLACQKAGIKRVIFHVEARYNSIPGQAGDTENILSKAGEFNFQKGLAINPETPVESIVPYLSNIDVVVLMSVNPGLQGQAFIKETLEKIKALRNLAPQIKIEVDGGINLDNIKAVSDAGADYLVVGSGLFKSDDIKIRFDELTLQIQ